MMPSRAENVCKHTITDEERVNACGSSALRLRRSLQDSDTTPDAAARLSSGFPSTDVRITSVKGGTRAATAVCASSTLYGRAGGVAAGCWRQMKRTDGWMG